MIVDDSWRQSIIVEAHASVWPPTIIIVDYHQLSFILSLFKLFMIVHDSFSRLTTRMIVHDSFTVSASTNTFQIHLPIHSSNKSITRKQAATLFRREKFIHLQVCLTGRHLVFTFLRGKSLELSALVTLFARLSVNYRQLSRTSLALWPCEWWFMIVWREWTIIDYHAPFDQGFN